MKMTIAPQVTPGTYDATFEGVSQTSHKEYGSGARWDFRIHGGDYSGSIVCRTTKDVASKNNSCGKFCETVSGLSLEDAIKEDSDDWLGVAGTIVVEQIPSGSVRVARFERDDSE